jgi:hypothetical protein
MFQTSLLVVAGLLVTACAPIDEAPDLDQDTDLNADTDEELHTAPPIDTAVEPFDCSTVPPGPRPYTQLDGLHAAEDFAFDAKGHLISHHDQALFRQEYPPGSVTPFATTEGGGGGPASLRMLSSGDLVYANVDTATLYRVAPSGASTVLYGALGYPTGIDIHPTGKVFLADMRGIMRIDPDNGEMELILEPGEISMPNGMTFSADYSTLYIGNNSGIFAVPVDAEGSPTGAPEVFTSETSYTELLGMGVDRCDNVYVLRGGSELLRYSADGAGPEVLLEFPERRMMTNLQWGSGIGGWDAKTIYITDRDHSSPAYYELDVQVPSKIY